MNQQNDCVICYEQRNVTNLECKCKICIDCFKQYLQMQINEFWTSDGSHLSLKCPGFCNETLYFDQLMQLASLNNFGSAIMDELFKKYCQKATDIIQCPNSNCNLYYLQPCKQECDIVCEQCKATLLNQQRFILSQYLQNALSKLQEFISTNECPRCSVLIAKNGGCSHMTCRYCKFEFCWNCKQDCNNHDWSICIFHCICLIVIKYFLYYNILYTMGVHIYLIKMICVIFSISYCFILNNIILALVWLFLNSVKLYTELQSSKNMILCRLIFSSTLLIIFSTIANQLVEISFLDWLWYIIKELLWSIVGIVLLTIINHFYGILFKQSKIE